MKKLLLGSNSPRRKELLQSMGFSFETVTIPCEEIFPPELKASSVPSFLSELKANAFRPLNEGETLLTADTIVSLDEKVLGKPQHKAEAFEMLQRLSSKTHTVYTSVTVKSSHQTITISDHAEVSFAEISPEETEFYLEKFQPFDKAGSYGIQEWLGMAKITKINGSFYTIMGLPTHLVYQQLKEMGF